MADTFSADPTVVFMTSVLQDIETGALQIPRFQRPLVWRWEQRRDLLSSVYEGLPIGALMIWSSDKRVIKTYDKLGPHTLPAAPFGAPGGRYLMDGVQRVSTLFGALKALKDWSDYDDEEEAEVSDFVVYADLDADREQDRFLRQIDIEEGELANDQSRFLPLRILLESREFLKFQRAIPDTKPARLDAADSVATAFKEYKIPLITLRSSDLDVVTKSFERINSRGAAMSEIHMLNALSYTEDFDLLSMDADLRRKELAPVNWENVDQEVILRCLKLKVGVDFYKKNADEVSARMKKEHVGALTDVYRGVRRCAEFLKENVGILTPDLVPYRMQAVSLAAALFDREYKEISQALEDWFWVTTYCEAFGSSARQSEIAMQNLNDYLKTKTFKWTLKQSPRVRSLEDLRIDFRSVRVKALALALARKQDGVKPAAAASNLSHHGFEAFCQIPFDPANRGRAAYRFVMNPTEIADFRSRVQDGQLTSEEMEKHFLTEKTVAELRSQKFGVFVKDREASMFEFECAAILEPAAQRLALSIAGIAKH